MMHNWIEGILQHHAHVKWGIGIVTTSADVEAPENPDAVQNPPLTPLASALNDDDMDTIKGELSALQDESQQFRDSPSHLKRLHSETSFFTSQNSNSSGDSQNDGDFQPDEESDEEDTEDLETFESWKATCIFDTATLSKIHACISNTVIPSWVQRPPSNLGEKSHGKLTANQWLMLFTIFLPLILPEIWASSTEQYYQDLLANFCDLMICTNIITSYSASTVKANMYLESYIRYRQSSAVLYPKVNSRPNHHYAMHNADLMKYWGPLTKLSEFTYEQHNGSLQKIKTNGHMCE
jgi:hypothetical protein